MKSLTTVLAVLCFISCDGFSATWPICEMPITSAFGPRCDPSNAFHAGVDIRSDGEDDVLASSSGTIWLVSPYINSPAEFSGYQYSVIIAHGLGPVFSEYSGYHHIQSLNDILVSQGEYVEEGEVIAFLNGSNHLHYNYWLSQPDGDDNTSHPLRIHDEES